MKSIIVCIAFGASLIYSQPAHQVGRQPDGSFLLPTGWRIQPVGEQIPVDTMPMSSAVSKDGKFLLILSGGSQPSIRVLTVDAPHQVARVQLPDAWLGLAFSPEGKKVYVGGGSRATVFEFDFSAEGGLKPAREFVIAPEDHRTAADFIGDVAVSPDGHTLYAADLYHDAIVAINTQSGRVIDKYKTGRRPYRILFHPDGKSFFVSSWADGMVYLHTASNGSESGRIRLGPHTTDMVLSDRKPEGDEATSRYRLFVTAGNTNSVFVVGVNDAKEMKVNEILNIALTPQQPLGMTPSGLAFSPDQTKLYVACSDANVLAAVDISEERSRVIGFIPTASYPTAARILPDARVLALNAGGTISVIDPLDDQTLAKYTDTARHLPRYQDTDLDWKPEKPLPVDHVIYIVKGNRAYDQVLGKIGKGNSDPAIALFDESVAPNHYKLAREFILFDNFYVNAESRANGVNWAAAAIAPDYTERLSPNSDAGRRKLDDYEGGEPANSPPAGYLWSNALSAGLSVRNYGNWVTNLAKPRADGVVIEKGTDLSLQSVTNLHYQGFDPGYPDVERARVFLDDLKQFESSGNMPRLIVMRLANDQSDKSAQPKMPPRVLFADNDTALGMIVEGVSKSRFWPHTAIFVIESDAEGGQDHVDPHRSPMFVISPYTRGGKIDSAFYNQSSVLRTIELILGMRPLTVYDAGAHPLDAAFGGQPDNTPYTAERAAVRP